MYILFGILAILFGGLHSIAAYYQLRQPEHPAETHLMLADGVSTLWAGIMSLLSIGSGDFVIATLGAVMIIAAAILNGKKSCISSAPSHCTHFHCSNHCNWFVFYLTAQPPASRRRSFHCAKFSENFPDYTLIFL